MKITVEKNVLVEGLNKVGKAIKANTTTASLEGVYLTVKGKGLLLVGSDKEITIATMIPCKDITQDGTTLINYRVFSDIIKKFPNGDIELTLDNLNLNIKCKKSSFSVIVMNHEEYPEMPKVNAEQIISLPQVTLKNMVRQTGFAIAQEDTRPILQGLLFEIKNKQLSIVGLDGYRLALQRESVELESEISVVVNGKQFLDIIKLFDDSLNDVKIGFTQNHILFDLGTTKVISRLLEGKFINYETLIPTDSQLIVDVNANELLDVIDRVALVGKESQGLIRMDIKDDVLVVSSKSTRGKAEEDLTVSMQGSLSEISICFNSRYILDLLKNTDMAELRLTLNSPISPCIVRDKNNDLNTYLVLPIRQVK